MLLAYAKLALHDELLDSRVPDDPYLGRELDRYFPNEMRERFPEHLPSGSSLSIMPIILFAQIRGDVLQDPHLGYALAFSMIVITGIANFIYIMLRSRAERWVK